VRVRLGAIDAAELDARMRSAPAAQPARTESLLDELWQAGCQAEALPAPLRYAAREPDVVCTLPGRTPARVVVVAHLDGKAQPQDVPRHWRGAALLPSLYRALSAAPREHSFELVAFGKSPRRSHRDYLERLGAPRNQDVRAIVDLQDLDPALVWFFSSDPALGRDLVAANLALGRPLESLRAFSGTRAEARAPTPTIVIAAAPPERARDPFPVVSEPAPPASGSYQESARLVALFLGYVDETLRLRAEPGAAPTVPAAPDSP
jgi:hypothetical protein